MKTSGWRPPSNPPSFLSTWLFFQQPFAFLLPTLPQSTLTPGPSRPKRRGTPPDIQNIKKEVHICRENYIVTEDSPKQVTNSLPKALFCIPWDTRQFMLSVSEGGTFAGGGEGPRCLFLFLFSFLFSFPLGQKGRKMEMEPDRKKEERKEMRKGTQSETSG